MFAKRQGRGSRRCALVSSVVFGAWVGLLVGLLDLPIVLRRMRLGIEQALLFQNGYPAFSIVTHSILLWVVVGVSIGAVSYLGMRRPRALTDPKATRRHLARIAVATGFLVWFCRVWVVVSSSAPSMGTFSKIALYSAVLWIVVVGVAWWLQRSKWAMTPCSRRGVVILCLAVVGIVAGLMAWPQLVFSWQQAHWSQGRSPGERPNVLLVVLDTVRADRLSSYGYPGTITPAIDALASQAMVFEKALSAAPWTLPSHATMFTGLHPSQHGASWENLSLGSQFVTLAESLSENGYQTVAVTENPFLNPAMGLTQGFQEIFQTNSQRITEEPLGFAIRAEIRRRFLGLEPTREATRESVGVLQSWLLARGESEQPFFAFVNLMAAHLPNYPRRDRQDSSYSPELLDRIEPVNLVPERFYLEEYRLDQDELQIMEELYEGEIRYLDRNLGDLVTFLRDLGILDDTVLIVTSDHGESFGEHGLIEHQLGLHNNLLHVPLLLRYPARIRAGSRIDWPVSTAQLFVTLLELVRLEVVTLDPGVERRSLVSPAGNDFVFAEYENGVEMLRRAIEKEAPDFDFEPYDRTLLSVQTSEFKLIRSSDGRDELYEIGKDWEETSNLIEARPDIAKGLRERLEEWQASLVDPEILGEEPELDRETQKALEVLGYVN